jgi:XTP/dITP diphosphohydrolase
MAQQPLTDAFARLVQILDELREKCPWDKKQTIQTLRPLTIEELYELADAITNNDWEGIKEELGDLLMHLLFYARIAKEQNRFTMEEVIQGINEKLVFRHPHIYGDPAGDDQIVRVMNEEDVKKNWEKLKLQEGKQSVLSGVPLALPAVIKALRLQEKARQVGFEWEKAGQVWDKVEEEMKELQQAVSLADKNQVEEEFGDLIFSLINYARFLRIDPENALEKTNIKFIERFTLMEKAALSNGKALSEMTLEEMDAIWESIKKQKLQD